MKRYAPKAIFAVLFLILTSVMLAGEGLISDLGAQSRPKVGLALSGGGAAGLAHIGVIKVLEEAGIPIDYVAGTSMGSIVGALFAMGYTGKEMEKLVTEMNWEELLTDNVPRSDLTFEYKEQLENYFYDFPFNSGKIQLPTGLVGGTNISNKLGIFTLPAYKLRMFNELPRPYVCVAADVVTGEEVVLRGGDLHDALRASMAIPTVFTPVEVNGRLLIDGGFINNFPADHLKEMGADIIIGVDVQRELFKRSQLHSVITILKQISSLTREDINARNRQLCNILIRPNTPGASTLTFGMADSIIRTGERYAREQWPALVELAGKLKSYPGGNKDSITPLPPVDSLFIREMAFTGLKTNNPDFLQSVMDLPFPGWVRPGEIYRAMQRAYGTNEFSKVTYQIQPVTDGVRLTVRVEEKDKNLVHVGLHFDNLFNASLLARADLRSLLRKGDQLGVEVNLGENPNLKASYYFLYRHKHQYGLETGFNRMKAYEFQDNRKISSQIFRDGYLDLVMRSTWRNRFAASAGLEAEFAWITPNIGDWQLQSYNSKMLNLFVQLQMDNFNRVPYPTRGDKGTLMVKEINNLTKNGNDPLLHADFRYSRAFELKPLWSLRPSIIATVAIGDSIPYPYQSYVGGLAYYYRTIVPFAGMDFMERSGNNSLVLGTDLQYQFRNNHYLILKVNAGKVYNTIEELRSTTSILAGAGLTYGYSSPVGPLEITLMSSNTSRRPIIFVNLGYWIR